MTVRTRRRIALFYVTGSFLALTALTVTSLTRPHFDWPLGFAAWATGIVSIACGLDYLHWTRGIRDGQQRGGLDG